LLFLLTSATPLLAQQQGGFWWDVGAGYGYHGCNDCNGNGGGVAGTIGLGGTVRPGWRVGVGSTLWTRNSDFGRLAVLTLEVRTRFYPRVNGFFLSGAVGMGADQRRHEDGAEQPENVAILSLGMGYDLHLEGTVSITPYIAGLYLHTGDGRSGLLHGGLALTFP
jgi:hypothetical protein